MQYHHLTRSRFDLPSIGSTKFPSLSSISVASMVYHRPFHPSLLQLLSNEKPHGTKIRTSQTQCMSTENWFSDDCHCRMSEVGNASNLLICSILHDKIGDNT